MNWLFWHSSDVFIQAHIETIYKLKKSLFRKYTSLISIQQWWHYLSGKHYALYYCFLSMYVYVYNFFYLLCSIYKYEF